MFCDLTTEHTKNTEKALTKRTQTEQRIWINLGLVWLERNKTHLMNELWKKERL